MLVDKGRVSLQLRESAAPFAIQHVRLELITRGSVFDLGPFLAFFTVSPPDKNCFNHTVAFDSTPH